jgi:dimethylargininase
MVEAVALTREVSASLGNCELTHLARVPIDVAVARAQHAAYERALAAAGYRVERLPGDPDTPDCVFVEDIAIVFDELAVVTRPGAVSRRGEVPAIADALAAYREIKYIEAPATVDGGDVLVAGRRVFVGRSSRTNSDAVAQLRRLVGRFGYAVCELEVRDCLHLKSAVTALSDEALLVNPDWVEATAFADLELVAVDPREPAAANVLRLADRVLVQSAFPRTADRLAARGLRVEAVDASELAKAEGAVTCCSLIVSRVGS